MMLAIIIFVAVIALFVWICLKLEKIDRRLVPVIGFVLGFSGVALQLSDHRYWRALFWGGFFFLAFTPPGLKSALMPSWVKSRVPSWWNTPTGELIEKWKARRRER